MIEFIFFNYSLTTSNCKCCSAGNSHRSPTISRRKNLKETTIQTNLLWPTQPCPLGCTLAWLNITNSYLGIIASVPVFPQPSPSLSIPLFSPLSAKAGSKNSGELNSHNNMRLSGDRRSTVCAGQHRGSNSSEPGLLTATKHYDKRVTVGVRLCVVS